ncbi:uncharacterized protein LOC124915615 [Impatiens glandulifera]|uniref:uncharacterized protein LOC124915615 n=1 Tax=Impatiens glandulifera TaxID=253017 RepID=UPI001FB0EE01|nr:uncharacterized protein LOC124915615 [Impatiens glandulifera]
MHCTQYHQYYPSLPCLQCQPQTYIRMVQQLIERCLLLQMDQDQCVQTLAHHANIPPPITLTVWGELLKENRDFFRIYLPSISPNSSFSAGRFLPRRSPWSVSRRN